MLAWIRIIALLPIILTLCQNGYLSPKEAAVILLLCVFLQSIDLLRLQYVLPLLGLLHFAWEQADNDPRLFIALMAQIATLSVILFGFFVMLGGLSQSRKRNR